MAKSTNWSLADLQKKGLSHNYTEAEKEISASVVVIPDEFRTIELVLLGTPMPKQSVRLGKYGAYQPAKLVERKEDYIRQIKAQLPKDFIPFTKQVHLIKFHCVYPPKKSFSKVIMDKIKNGEIIYKTTRADIDNIQKLVYDSMSGLVFKDDGLICTGNDFAKYYGLGGAIIIILKGK